MNVRHLTGAWSRCFCVSLSGLQWRSFGRLLVAEVELDWEWLYAYSIFSESRANHIGPFLDYQLTEYEICAALPSFIVWWMTTWNSHSLKPSGVLSVRVRLSTYPGQQVGTLFAY